MPTKINRRNPSKCSCECVTPPPPPPPECPPGYTLPSCEITTTDTEQYVDITWKVTQLGFPASKFVSIVFDGLEKLPDPPDDEELSYEGTVVIPKGELKDTYTLTATQENGCTCETTFTSPCCWTVNNHLVTISGLKDEYYKKLVMDESAVPHQGPFCLNYTYRESSFWLKNMSALNGTWLRPVDQYDNSTSCAIADIPTGVRVIAESLEMYEYRPAPSDAPVCEPVRDQCGNDLNNIPYVQRRTYEGEIILKFDALRNQWAAALLVDTQTYDQFAPGDGNCGYLPCTQGTPSPDDSKYCRFTEPVDPPVGIGSVLRQVFPSVCDNTSRCKDSTGECVGYVSWQMTDVDGFNPSIWSFHSCDWTGDTYGDLTSGSDWPWIGTGDGSADQGGCWAGSFLGEDYLVQL